MLWEEAVTASPPIPEDTSTILQDGTNLQLLKDIDKRNLTLEDKKNLLKLFITLPLINKYQDEKLPDLDQLRNIKEELEVLIRKVDKEIDMN